MDAKKYYSPICHLPTTTEDGKTTNYAVVKGLLIFNDELKTITSTETDEVKNLLRASMPLTNANERIARILGVDVPEGETVWLTVNFWNRLAERMENFRKHADNPQKVTAVVIGRLSAVEYARKDGTPAVDYRLDVRDFM